MLWRDRGQADRQSEVKTSTLCLQLLAASQGAQGSSLITRAGCPEQPAAELGAPEQSTPAPAPHSCSGGAELALGTPHISAREPPQPPTAPLAASRKQRLKSLTRRGHLAGDKPDWSRGCSWGQLQFRAVLSNYLHCWERKKKEKKTTLHLICSGYLLSLSQVIATNSSFLTSC